MGTCLAAQGARNAVATTANATGARVHGEPGNGSAENEHVAEESKAAHRLAASLVPQEQAGLAASAENERAAADSKAAHRLAFQAHLLYKADSEWIRTFVREGDLEGVDNSEWLIPNGLTPLGRVATSAILAWHEQTIRAFGVPCGVPPHVRRAQWTSTARAVFLVLRGTGALCPANLARQSRVGWTPLMHAAADPVSYEFLGDLLAHALGAPVPDPDDPEARNEEFRRILALPPEEKRPRFARAAALLAVDHSCPSSRDTVLHCLLASASPWDASAPITRTLLAMLSPTTVNAENRWGETALHIAARKGLHDSLEFLLLAGADPLPVGRDGLDAAAFAQIRFDEVSAVPWTQPARPLTWEHGPVRLDLRDSTGPPPKYGTQRGAGDVEESAVALAIILSAAQRRERAYWSVLSAALERSAVPPQLARLVLSYAILARSASPTTTLSEPANAKPVDRAKRAEIPPQVSTTCADRSSPRLGVVPGTLPASAIVMSMSPASSNEEEAVEEDLALDATYDTPEDAMGLRPAPPRGVDTYGRSWRWPPGE
jgi:Ankyrin repeat